MVFKNSQNCDKMSEIQAHHKVKNFYHNNLFRKTYTVLIIGLVGLNVFSMPKDVSFAEELFADMTPTQEIGDVVNEIGIVDNHTVDNEESENVASNGISVEGVNESKTNIETPQDKDLGENLSIKKDNNLHTTDLECEYGYKERNGECVENNGLYYGGINYNDDRLIGSEDDIMSLVTGGKTVLNLKNNPVEYGDGVNPCGEGFHILNSDDVNLMFDIMDADVVGEMIGESQDTTQQEPEGLNLVTSKAFDECKCKDRDYWCSCGNYNYYSDLIVEATAENAAVISYPVYINYLNKFGYSSMYIETDTEDPVVVHEFREIDQSEIQPDTLVMCATSLPVVTFVDANGYIVEQKGLEPGHR